MGFKELPTVAASTRTLTEKESAAAARKRFKANNAPAKRQKQARLMGS
jgi:hypothetical protein